ncbi:RdgB/HAM1 family non-canonical purine NTP pyrophosphatase [Luteimonas vadosa]|uniref:dITP/XTP pyrophosphatase n=1 Tax=Luteimonas vadosa TaxID=1165507 RepID=A0ABP9DZG6_9GAMM
MRRLVLASGNAGKLREFGELLAGSGIACVPQAELGVHDIEETGLSFVENALIKARHAARQTGLPALADDSGLCVDALEGAPGLLSARYASVHGNADANIDKLLAALESVPDDRRGAHFHASIVLLRHAEDPQPIIAEGRWRGSILHSRHGQGGFGYDPVFQVPGYDCSAAQLEPAVKNSISHRGQALAILGQRLSEAV